MIIIKKAKLENRKKGNGLYYEQHHILPKSIFPLWKNLNYHKFNKILLTAREHFFCHQLLEKIYPGEKMFLALWRLVNDGQNNYITKNSKEYERLKIKFSINNPGKNPSEETRRKMSISAKGKKQSPETVEKRRQKLIGLKRNFTKESSKNMGKHMIGKMLSQEIKDKISKSLSEYHKNNPKLKIEKIYKTDEELKNIRKKAAEKRSIKLKGHYTSDETRQKISLANKGKKRTLEQIEKIKNAKKQNDQPKIWCNNGFLNKVVFTINDIPPGFTRGRIKSEKCKIHSAQIGKLIWCTNGSINKRVKSIEDFPIGFYSGHIQKKRSKNDITI